MCPPSSISVVLIGPTPESRSPTEDTVVVVDCFHFYFDINSTVITISFTILTHHVQSSSPLLFWKHLLCVFLVVYRLYSLDQHLNHDLPQKILLLLMIVLIFILILILLLLPYHPQKRHLKSSQHVPYGFEKVFLVPIFSYIAGSHWSAHSLTITDRRYCCCWWLCWFLF